MKTRNCPSLYCSFCDLTFTKPKFLDEHVKSVHPTENNMGRYNEIENLEPLINDSQSNNAQVEDIETDSGNDSEDEFKLGDCNLTNFLGLFLNPTDTTHLCSVCNIQFSTRDELEVHEKNHNDKVESPENIFEYTEDIFENKEDSFVDENIKATL